MAREKDAKNTLELHSFLASIERWWQHVFQSHRINAATTVSSASGIVAAVAVAPDVWIDAAVMLAINTVSRPRRGAPWLHGRQYGAVQHRALALSGAQQLQHSAVTTLRASQLASRLQTRMLRDAVAQTVEGYGLSSVFWRLFSELWVT